MYFAVFTGVYCSGIFCLIGISILETIIVNYLMAKGSESRSAVENTDAATGCDGKNLHSYQQFPIEELYMR